VAGEQTPPDLVERVGLAAPVPEAGLLGPTTDLVERGVGERERCTTQFVLPVRVGHGAASDALTTSSNSSNGAPVPRAGSPPVNRQHGWVRARIRGLAGARIWCCGRALPHAIKIARLTRRPRRDRNTTTPSTRRDASTHANRPAHCLATERVERKAQPVLRGQVTIEGARNASQLPDLDRHWRPPLRSPSMRRPPSGQAP
jgi:hypothetical protein